MDVVQLGQMSYFPLFARPVEWFMQTTIDDGDVPSYLEDGRTLNVSTSSNSSSFSSAAAPLSEKAAAAAVAAARVATIANELLFYEKREVEPAAMLVREADWYGSLSGGQRSKADFIRTVFLRKGGCPALLLVDEGFAALDPRSKGLVQKRLKSFCKDSLVLAIYHTDAETTKEAAAAAVAAAPESSEEQEGEDQDRQPVNSGGGCIPGGFFDANLHFQNGSVELRPLC